MVIVPGREACDCCFAPLLALTCQQAHCSLQGSGCLPSASSKSIVSKARLRVAVSRQVDEHADLAKPAQVELHKLFASLKLSQVSELSLSANQLQSDVKRLKWQAGKSMSDDSVEPIHWDQHPAVMCKADECSNEDLTVVLNPMEIRTFLLQLA